MNLARNAVEHSGEMTRIAIGSRAAGHEVEFWVSDEGEGIPPEDQKRIFERFSRGGAGERNTEGSGLGLAIVEAIVSAHGGRVQVRSAPGVGSRFTLVFPAGE
jgi:signal transduction histidine kinase